MRERNADALWALQALLDDPECPDQVVELGEGEVRVERSPEPGVKLRMTPMDRGAESERWVVRTFDPADAPPGAYPHQLPFLAGLPVMVWENGRPRTMIAVWENAPQASALLSSLVGASREQGWGGAPATGAEGAPPQFVSLSRDDGRRVIAYLSAQGRTLLMVSDSVAG
jgi:hypothetical protein